MERKDIFEKLTVVFRQVMDNDGIVLDEYTSANDIDEWDSLTHVQLTEQIQEEFGIKFSAQEMNTWIDVGEMVDCIEKKIK